MQRVVITGLGIHSCLGESIPEVKESLYQGKSGIVFDQERKDFGFRGALTGKVNMPDIKGKLSRRQRVGLAEQAVYGFVATEQALEQARIDMDYLDTHEVGILFGNDSSARATVESVDLVREKKDTMLLGSGSVFQAMNCTVTMNLSTIFRLKGVNFTISGACASGSHAIGLAFLLIRQGLQDCIICGGAQEVNKYAFGSFDAISAFSTREDEPQKASRPFDKDRDGLIPSGGAAALVVESLESAKRRGARILGEIVGYGFSSNGEHISNPNIDGQLRSLRMAMKQAGIEPGQVDYINAHATSTPVGDEAEAQAIHEIFQGHNTPVSSTKSMTGHECWMAGASEVVYGMIMMENGFIAPNINFETPDAFSAKLNIFAATADRPIDCFLSNSFGFGGTNSTLVVRKFGNE